VFLRRVAFLRAVLAGLAATLTAAVVATVTRQLPPVDGGMLALFGLAGEGAALLFALAWDVIPPRTRPVSKALVYGTLVFLIARLDPPFIPAAAAYALMLGIAYRPHPASPAARPETPALRVDPPVRTP
jgi:hypothetical protein